MNTIASLFADLPGFSWWLFEGCAQQVRTRLHLGTCVAARLHEVRRKTHQPVGMKLAETQDDADALRQRINRAYLSEWSDELVRDRLHEAAKTAIGDAVALVIDDTGIEKKGVKSPGVHRQYTGTAGKITNCQVIVSTHLASHTASVPLEMDLYLPEAWCDDAARRKEARIPDTQGFRTKGEIALAQVDRIRKRGVGADIVIADAGYGDSVAFREGLVARGLHYAVGVSGTGKAWRFGEGPDAPIRRATTGRPPTRELPGKHQPVECRQYAKELPADAWQVIELRPGRANPMRSRFATVRVRTAHRAAAGRSPGDDEWLIIEWPSTEPEPRRYFLCTLPADTPPAELARLVKLRWRVERDYQDAKQEIGLDQYEGRRWAGFNHHLTLCMAAMTFLVGCRAFSPQRNPIVARGPATASGPSLEPVGPLSAL
jgi:SRSO17 transposase